MQTIVVELLNDKALSLLQQLEQLNILRLVVTKPQIDKPKRQWAGSIPKASARKMLEYNQQSRNEWERNI